jgi:hypothetical protein
VENLVVESEVIARDDVDTGLLLDIPVLKTKSLGLAEQINLGELSAPVCLGRLLQVTVDSHTRETENRSVMDTRISMLKLRKTSAVVEAYD